MKILLTILCCVIVLAGCNNSQKTNIPENNPVYVEKILTQAVLFKTAAEIQEKYFFQNRLPTEDNLRYFLEYLNDTVISKKRIKQSKVDIQRLDGRYKECIDEIINSDQSYWSIRKILEKYRFTHIKETKGEIIFDPYVFLPEPVDLEKIKSTDDFDTQWDFFYTGLLLDNKEIVDAVFPGLIKNSGDYADDLSLFNELMLLYKGDYSRPFSARSLSHYYLLTGNIDKNAKLTDAEYQKLLSVTRHFDQNIYLKSYAGAHPFAVDNKIYMWLAAREQEMKGNLKKAYVLIKATFGPDVLKNLRKFLPHYQAYLFTTIRIALKFNSPTVYRYVYGALDPLTKIKTSKYKEWLKLQLLQLLN
jgi:hypothetical protein